MQEKIDELIKTLNTKYIKVNEPISKHTVVKIGGPADIWYEPPTTEEFVAAVKKARELNIPVTVIGRGSNTLISDKGIRGLVIRNGSKNIKVGNEFSVEETTKLEKDTQSRWEGATEAEGARKMYDFKDLDYDESEYPRVEVKIDSGVDMAFAMNYLITQGITGLQWYSRIPGNMGGWIYNNTHGGTHFINEVVKSVSILAENGDIITLNHDDLSFGYDESRFHKTHEIILDATLNLYKGDKQRAKEVAIEWAKRKSIQPPISTGCIFANISNEMKEKLGYPTGSVGYIIEHILELSGFRIGDAAISINHHNFIENKGKATAADYLSVVQEIQKKAEQKLGFKFKPEIFFLGFTPEEINSIQ